MHEERERARRLFRMLAKRSEDAKLRPERRPPWNGATFTVLLHPETAKASKDAEGPVKDGVIARLEELRDDPEAGKPLKHSGFWS